MVDSVKSIVVFCLICLVSIGAHAQTPKVVVIPLGADPDPNLIPENICHGVTISGISGTRNCNPTVISADDRIWMDRNLGASRVATFSSDSLAYGDYYQWGRDADGHESSSSPVTDILSSTDSPGHGDFIANGSSSPYDWRAPQNDNLWQGVSGINNPCPAGFRLPTNAEIIAEMNSWSPQNSDGAFSSPLRLPVAGYRNSNAGFLFVDTRGYLISSDTNGVDYRYVEYNTQAVSTDYSYRSEGSSIRCIFD